MFFTISVCVLITKCHHESNGPPLKSFLFELDADAASEALFEEYTSKLIAALEQIVTKELIGLELQDRVAILVPDKAFLDGLTPLLAKALEEEADERLSGRHFVLTDAKEAAGVLFAGGRSGQEGEALVQVISATMYTAPSPW